MEIKTKLNIDDEVWVIENVGDRMRPVKRRVYGVHVTATPSGTREEYFSSEGPLTETFPTIEVAEAALKIIEEHKTSFSKAMKALMDGVKTPKTELVDANGKKMV